MTKEHTSIRMVRNQAEPARRRGAGWRWVTMAATAVLLSAALALPAAAAPVKTCKTNADCDDGIFCNGKELCQKSSFPPGGICKGTTGFPCELELYCSHFVACSEAIDKCLYKPRSCSDGVSCTIDSCDESARTCRHDAPDADADGHRDAHCAEADPNGLNDDCDDANHGRYPGATEICDADDEDCDPATIGYRDADRDNHNDHECCNAGDSDALPLCGNDCDDSNPAIQPGSMVCEGVDDPHGVKICRSDGNWQASTCAPRACVPQPNLTGVCKGSPADDLPSGQ